MDYDDYVAKGLAKIAARVADAGEQAMREKFANAQYDGTNDVKVSLQKNSDTEYEIIAEGNATLFIEFGSGVHYNQGTAHPLGQFDGVANIGEFGNGQGSHQGWVYKGEPGTNGVELANGRVFTRGNPAAMPMYHAHKAILKEKDKATKEIFG